MNFVDSEERENGMGRGTVAMNALYGSHADDHAVYPSQR